MVNQSDVSGDNQWEETLNRLQTLQWDENEGDKQQEENRNRISEVRSLRGGLQTEGDEIFLPQWFHRQSLKQMFFSPPCKDF